MDKGQPEIDIPVQLNKLHVGQRYTFYFADKPNVGIRVTYLNEYQGIPENPNSHDMIMYMPDGGVPTTISLQQISRITQFDIGPGRDTANLINSYLGGRKKRKKRKSRKSKRRRRKKRKTRKKRKSRKRRR